LEHQSTDNPASLSRTTEDFLEKMFFQAVMEKLLRCVEARTHKWSPKGKEPDVTSARNKK
jgi:hypothetical protein